jgi:hypothetical protein
MKSYAVSMQLTFDFTVLAPEGMSAEEVEDIARELAYSDEPISDLIDVGRWSFSVGGPWPADPEDADARDAMAVSDDRSGFTHPDAASWIEDEAGEEKP